MNHTGFDQRKKLMRDGKANNVSLRYSKLWGNSLNRGERLELVAMVERVAAAGGPPSQRQDAIVWKLRERLGLIN